MGNKRYMKHMNWHDDKCYKAYKCDPEDDKDHCGCNKCSYKDNKHQDKFDNNCKGCICELLKCLEPTTLVDIFLSSSSSFPGVIFISLDSQKCCAYFLEAGGTNTPLIINCRKIDAIRRNPA